jgi:predicted GNAT family N-acyltransferase
MFEFKLIYGMDGYEHARSVREKVFMDEQGFSFDADELDSISWHIIGYDKGKIIAAARMYQKDGGVFSIGRVAVDAEYRGQYIGDTLMRALEDKTVQLKGYAVEIGAQEGAVGFYEKEGYEKTGKTYAVEGIKHCEMIKDLSKVKKRCGCCH